MSATATRPAASPPGARGGERPPIDDATNGAGLPLLGPARARLVALTALGAFAALRWATLVEPSGAGRMLLLLAFAIGAGAATALLARLSWWLQGPAALLVVLAWTVMALLAAGAPAALVFDPRHWDELASGIRDGLGQLPRVLVPYGAEDPWPRVTILLGGGLLLVLGCVLAQSPGRSGVPFRDGAPFGGGTGLRLVAALPLVAATAVPAAVLKPDHPALTGAVLFVLLAAFLWLERLPRAHVPAALALLVLTLSVGMVAAPQLDRPQPWVDAQALVEGLNKREAARFDWSQRYGPLDWPRDGREVLRVEAPWPSYWKAANLDGFDGVRWVRSAPPRPLSPLDETPAQALQNPEWRMSAGVTLGSFKTSDLIGAGTTFSIEGAPRGVMAGGSPGTWVVNEPLGPGAAYVVSTIVPRPSQAQLRSAGTDYPDVLERYHAIALPQRDEAESSGWRPGARTVLVPAFRSVDPITAAGAARQLAASPYARTFALARHLAAGATTPYAFVQRVLAHLRDGYAYSEGPPRRTLPLPAFLFVDRFGYCQQFAGAAALLLRMGGVPARVVAGFTRGARDPSGAYVVRDYDAHAWIEVWFPQIGWVSFDATPSSAPALSGPRHVGARSTVTAPVLPRLRQEVGGAALDPQPAAHDAGGPSWPLIALAAIATLIGLVLGARRLLPTATGADGLRLELERALRRTGRPPEPSLTLAQLERRFQHAPDAEAYVRALRLGRYADGDAAVTARQRRALRAELARGLGVGGRLRALVALPPRWPR